MTNRWGTADIPDQSGRVFVVTGASDGLGREATRALAEKGGHVVMACRNAQKAQQAREQFGEHLASRTEVRTLDLADLASVRTFAQRMEGRRIDVLVNNAGVMVTPQQATADGHELQWGTNVLGPFLLTALLMPRVADRVVWLSSHAHCVGRVHLDDPDGEHRRYQAFLAYGQSKLDDLVLSCPTSCSGDWPRRVHRCAQWRRTRAMRPPRCSHGRTSACSRGPCR